MKKYKVLVTTLEL